MENKQHWGFGDVAAQVTTSGNLETSRRYGGNGALCLMSRGAFVLFLSYRSLLVSLSKHLIVMQEISHSQVSSLNKTKGKCLCFLLTGLIYLFHKHYLNPVTVL